jgi:hypothetical protein
MAVTKDTRSYTVAVRLSKAEYTELNQVLERLSARVDVPLTVSNYVRQALYQRLRKDKEEL